jgi:hypothetical protein
MCSDSALLRPMSLMPAASTASETAGVRYVTVTSEPHYLPVTITTGKLATRMLFNFLNNILKLSIGVIKTFPDSNELLY